MITEDEILYIFSDLTNERRNVEFKTSMNWDDNATKYKVVKSVLAFSNTRGGGYLVFGVREDEHHHFHPDGMSRNDFDSFSNFDSLLSYVNGKAEPPATLEQLSYEAEDERLFFVIKISEFDTYPIVCKNGVGGVVHTGGIYVRTKSMPQTSPLDNQTNLKEIVDMIIDKHMEEFARRLQQVSTVQERDDEESYEEELGDL